jgi:hypothetical protein
MVITMIIVYRIRIVYRIIDRVINGIIHRPATPVIVPSVRRHPYNRIDGIVGIAVPEPEIIIGVEAKREIDANLRSAIIYVIIGDIPGIIIIDQIPDLANMLSVTVIVFLRHETGWTKCQLSSAFLVSIWITVIIVVIIIRIAGRVDFAVISIVLTDSVKSSIASAGKDKNQEDRKSCRNKT